MQMAMNNFDVFRQVITYCKFHKNFRVGIYISNRSRSLTVENLIKDVVKYYEYENDIKIIKNLNTYEISFNGSNSYIQMVTPTENMRGKKYNFLIIESCISKELKDNIIYPSFIPQIEDTISNEGISYMKHPVDCLEMIF